MIRLLTNRSFTNFLRYYSATIPTEKNEKYNLRPIYLDNLASTKLDPRVLDSMMPYLLNICGDPNTRTHAYGRQSKKAVELGRKQVADLIGANEKEIIFTSGATESNNLAIKGVARFYKEKKNHIITAQTEYKCVLDSCRALSEEGFEITYLPVKSNGLINMEELKGAMKPTTSIVSIMTVNNEIGVIQPIHEIGALCRERKVFFHTDAAQAVGKIKINVDEMKIDLMSISCHKIYGPQGIGALYIRGRPQVRLIPIQSGGQERGICGGMLSTDLCAGMGEACRIANQEMNIDHVRITALSERLKKGIMSQLPLCSLNGDEHSRYPGCLNISFAYVEAESLLMALNDIALSSDSACDSGSLEPSYVLRAMGTEEDLARSSIRFGIGRFTTEEEVDYTIGRCVTEVKKLREQSPLWKMVQQ